MKLTFALWRPSALLGVSNGCHQQNGQEELHSVDRGLEETLIESPFEMDPSYMPPRWKLAVLFSKMINKLSVKQFMFYA